MSTLNEMWDVMAAYQPYAESHGFGSVWAQMCAERTKESALEAEKAAKQFWLVEWAARIVSSVIEAGEQNVESSIQFAITLITTEINKETI